MDKIELHDTHGNFYHGKLKDGEKIDLWDAEGSYWWGKLRSDGKIELFDANGNYRWGKLKDGGRSNCTILPALICMDASKTEEKTASGSGPFRPILPH